MASPQERPLPAPLPTEESLPFWQAALEDRFLVKRCLACGQVHWYPRAICPLCFSDRTEWQTGSGRGTVHAFTVMRRAPQPFAIAFVTLEEGPSMLTNLVDCDFDRLAIGQAVRVVFKPTDGPWRLPVFTPTDATP